MMKPVIGYWQLGTPADYAEQAGNRLIGVVALRFASGNTFTEEDYNAVKQQVIAVHDTLPTEVDGVNGAPVEGAYKYVNVTYFEQ